MTPADPTTLEDQIALWRSHMERRTAVDGADVDELEDHLRGHIDALTASGLSADEAFLVSVKRLGRQDAIAHEFAQENSKRLWKQLVLGSDSPSRAADARASGFAAVAFALLAAAAVRLPQVFGLEAAFYARNVTLLAFVPLAAYLLWRRRASRGIVVTSAAALVAVAAIANIYPLGETSDALIVTALHVPILTWLLVLVAYSGDRWRTVDGRMDAVRFTGEWIIYLTLLALGGGVLTGVVVAVSEAAGVDSDAFVTTWLIPCGAAGAVVIAAWLVEAKQSVVENMAPVLAKVFTPLFALTFALLLAVVVATGDLTGLDRDVLLISDVILVIAVGLVLYNLSARAIDATHERRAGWFDRAQLAVVAGALALDIVALVNIVGRIDDGGWTINRVVVLGLNVILLVNLAVTAWLLGRLMASHPGAAHAIERWQTALIPVYGAWAVVAILALPPLLGVV
ncbi:permease prefix domain 1-containing protein [Demequina sp. SO4-18]|uniref:permease prefix domain 1-containing protein n=1 Tax=Demequina sp. SO4-18 TaxID=3401026 RepID=UPI003B5BFA6B